MRHSTTRHDVSPLLHQLGGVYRDPLRVSRDGNNLLSSLQGKSLKPKVSSVTLNDGTTHDSVLTFAGTIEMPFQGVTYNIPVEIFIPPGYPIRPPLCFVRPVEGMALKENHRNVGGDGMVYMPYLNQWRQHSSTLPEMILLMGSIFGNEPPVFKKPAGAPAPAPAPAPNVYQPPRYDQVQTQTGIGGANDFAREEQEKREREEAEALARVLSVLAGSEKLAKIEEEVRTTTEARDKLSKKLTTSLEKLYSEKRVEIASSMNEQARLDHIKKGIAVEMTGLKKNIEILNAHISHADNQTDKITKLIEKQQSKGETPVDHLAIPGTVHSRQMLELSAQNAAIADCLYYIDKALVSGKIELTVHLKEIRKLAKKQFFARAHLVKIKKLQGEAPLLS